MIVIAPSAAVDVLVAAPSIVSAPLGSMTTLFVAFLRTIVYVRPTWNPLVAGSCTVTLPAVASTIGRDVVGVPVAVINSPGMCPNVSAAWAVSWLAARAAVSFQPPPDPSMKLGVDPDSNVSAVGYVLDASKPQRHPSRMIRLGVFAHANTLVGSAPPLPEVSPMSKR